jgi:hypothetical protein
MYSAICRPYVALLHGREKVTVRFGKELSMLGWVKHLPGQDTTWDLCIAEFGLAYIKALLAPGSASGGLPGAAALSQPSDPAGLAG